MPRTTVLALFLVAALVLACQPDKPSDAPADAAGPKQAQGSEASDKSVPGLPAAGGPTDAAPEAATPGVGDADASAASGEEGSGDRAVSVGIAPRSAPERADGASARHALVIGNQAYTEGALKNSVSDATAIADALKGLGFSVTLKTDLDRKGMRKAVGAFVSTLADKDVALFYYAGHGLEIDGANYLLGVEFTADNPADAQEDGYNIGSLMKRLNERKKAFNIVVLDACRNDPFSRSWSRSARGGGFAKVASPLGTYVAFSTAPGNTAKDGTGPNSPFTTALLTYMREPDLELEYVFRRVRRDVVETTDGKQVPWSNSNLINDFFFVGAGKPATVVAAAGSQQGAVAPPHEGEGGGTRAPIAAGTGTQEAGASNTGNAAGTDTKSAGAGDDQEAWRFLTDHPGSTGILLPVDDATRGTVGANPSIVIAKLDLSFVFNSPKQHQASYTLINTTDQEVKVPIAAPVGMRCQGVCTPPMKWPQRLYVDGEEIEARLVGPLVDGVLLGGEEEGSVERPRRVGNDKARDQAMDRGYHYLLVFYLTFEPNGSHAVRHTFPYSGTPKKTSKLLQFPLRNAELWGAGNIEMFELTVDFGEPVSYCLGSNVTGASYRVGDHQLHAALRLASSTLEPSILWVPAKSILEDLLRENADIAAALVGELKLDDAQLPAIVQARDPQANLALYTDLLHTVRAPYGAQRLPNPVRERLSCVDRPLAELIVDPAYPWLGDGVDKKARLRDFPRGVRGLLRELDAALTTAEVEHPELPL